MIELSYRGFSQGSGDAGEGSPMRSGGSPKSRPPKRGDLYDLSNCIQVQSSDMEKLKQAC